MIKTPKLNFVKNWAQQIKKKYSKLFCISQEINPGKTFECNTFKGYKSR